MKKTILTVLFSLTFVVLMAQSGDGCSSAPSSDDIQREQQEKVLQEGTSAIGMPAIKNFQEKRILKDILELRDQTGYVTYTYIFSEYLGKFIYVGQSISYGIPAATQFTNPQKVDFGISHGSYYREVMPQADPNGLFSPSSAEGTWVLLKDPNSSDVKPIYCEPRIVVSPFKLPKDKVIGDY